METNEFEYKIEKHFGNLSEFTNKNGINVTKQVNKISYHGGEAKIDIRTWKIKDNDIRMFKGLTLSNSEARNLLNILSDMAEAGVI